MSGCAEGGQGAQQRLSDSRDLQRWSTKGAAAEGGGVHNRNWVPGVRVIRWAYNWPPLGSGVGGDHGGEPGAER